MLDYIMLVKGKMF